MLLETQIDRDILIEWQRKRIKNWLKSQENYSEADVNYYISLSGFKEDTKDFFKNDPKILLIDKKKLKGMIISSKEKELISTFNEFFELKQHFEL